MIPSGRVDQTDHVTIWDCGPEAPQVPEKLDLDHTDVDFDHRKAEYDAAMAKYRADLRAFNDWQERTGGDPQPVRMHASDANHALDRDPRQWSLDKPQSVQPSSGQDVGDADEDWQQGSQKAFD